MNFSFGDVTQSAGSRGRSPHTGPGGDRRFPGHVVRIGEEMGPKNIRTDEPTERVDKKVLQTLVRLDDGHELPVGLRVYSFILVSQPTAREAPPSSR